MKVSQLDQMKEAYEDGLRTLKSIAERISIMKEVDIRTVDKPLIERIEHLATYGNASSYRTLRT
jgi:Asp-tRNA(Asn)/Glu-tRNA(Gln) amidotransferase C subunit